MTLKICLPIAVVSGVPPLPSVTLVVASSSSNLKSRSIDELYWRMPLQFGSVAVEDSSPLESILLAASPVPFTMVAVPNFELKE